MSHPAVTGLLEEAASKYASARRPTLATCHRELRCAVTRENEGRAAEGLTQLACPSLGTLADRIRSLDPVVVHAARHGRASRAAWATGVRS